MERFSTLILSNMDFSSNSFASFPISPLFGILTHYFFINYGQLIIITFNYNTLFKGLLFENYYLILILIKQLDIELTLKIIDEYILL